MRVMALALCLLALPAYAEEEDETLLVMTETADRVVPRDRLTVAMRAEVMGRDAGEVQQQINDQMQKSMAIAREAAKDGRIVISTSSYNVREQNEYHENKVIGVFVVGQQTVNFVSDDITGLTKLATELQKSGLKMSGMGFSVSPAIYRQVTDELGVEVLKRIQQRAAVMAEAIGKEVENIKSITTNPSSNPRASFKEFARPASLAKADDAPIQTESGEATISVTFGAEVILR